jgi:diacylglycerol kinase family enzyme
VGLIVNPNAGSGQGWANRLDTIMRVFAARGVEACAMETTSATNSTERLAAEAAKSCDLVIACGGDGTVHGVLQGVAQTRASLGVLPFGTANALARNLGLPLDPVAALNRLLGYTARPIPLGFAETANGSRWFTVMAGAGPDGRLVHEMKLAAKARAGRAAYYAEAARLFVTRRFPAFRVEYRAVGSIEWETREAVAMMASRIPDLGGLFRGLTATSRLHHPHLVVQLLAAPAHLSLPAWMTMGRTGWGRQNPWLTTVEADEVRCVPLDGRGGVYVQVDGEPMREIPMSVRIVQDGVRLLMP